MTTQNASVHTSVQQVKILDEIVNNAIGLPLESQDLPLMLAKAMRHTRDCITQQSIIEQSRKPPENRLA